MNKYNKQLNWFKERIGKKVYRNTIGCNCDVCKKNQKTGILIIDEQHAQYLTDVSLEINVVYRDFL